MIDLNEAFEGLVQLIREGKLIVENISCEPHLHKLGYYEYKITIREVK